MPPWMCFNRSLSAPSFNCFPFTFMHDSTDNLHSYLVRRCLHLQVFYDWDASKFLFNWTLSKICRWGLIIQQNQEENFELKLQQFSKKRTQLPDFIRCFGSFGRSLVEPLSALQYFKIRLFFLEIFKHLISHQKKEKQTGDGSVHVRPCRCGSQSDPVWASGDRGTLQTYLFLTFLLRTL